MTRHDLATLVIAAGIAAVFMYALVVVTHDVIAHRRRPPATKPPTVHGWVWNGEEFDRIWNDHQARKAPDERR